jgi:hypothetical protein
MALSGRTVAALNNAFGDYVASQEMVGVCGNASRLAAAQSPVVVVSVTATTHTLPTADGTLTVADATTPTVAELLEYCTELKANITTIKTILHTHGLTT